MKDRLTYIFFIPTVIFDVKYCLTGNNIAFILGIIASIVTIVVGISAIRKNKCQKKLAKENLKLVKKELENYEKD